MKKIIKISFILLSFMFILTGCVSTDDRESILKCLEKEDYIQSDWELIDKNDDVGILGIDGYNYIYKDSDEVLHEISINAKHNENDKGKDIYYITITDNIEQKKSKNPNYGSNKYEEEYNVWYEGGEFYKNLEIEKGFFEWKISE